MGATLYRITDETAARLMEGLRVGKTPRMFAITPARLEAYLQTHLDYAAEARPLIAANARAAQNRKGNGYRHRTHCKHGHSLADAIIHVQKRGNCVARYCRTCRSIRHKRPGVVTPESRAKVLDLLKRQTPLSHVYNGANGSYVMSYVTFTQLRRDDSEINSLAVAVIAGAQRRAQKLRWTRVRTQRRREQDNDYYVIRAMLPANFPDRDDVVSAIFEDLLRGALKREDVRARVKSYVAAHNRLFPTKYAKFGDSPLVSLDEALYDDGSGTRGDTVSRGLWG
ncbi:hypothetical protein IVA80_15490 [Bradyrhizobium sp. 139]|uniref:hypothetical protein n=1 Tax=Bradyrhizobium sp. 139 TaxID=2782616 RepID=UPI001FF86A6F|nr:hypothetical protein [Bradyrhizobium sp. 139]MCK1742228.1 hypothetical protein [Bradyrhizobium sp. 139]